MIDKILDKIYAESYIDLDGYEMEKVQHHDIVRLGGIKFVAFIDVSQSIPVISLVSEDEKQNVAISLSEAKYISDARLTADELLSFDKWIHSYDDGLKEIVYETFVRQYNFAHKDDEISLENIPDYTLLI